MSDDLAKRIEAHAVRLVAEGGEATAEDDLDEMESFDVSEEQAWRDACDLGVKMAQAIGNNADSFAAWFRSVTADG